MEINITQFFNTATPRDYSASVAEIGNDAGPSTWRAACDDVADYGPMLATPAQLQALRDYVRGFGAWSDDEIAAWSDVECNALFIQLISGDILESPLDSGDWEQYKEWSEQGICSSNIFRADDGQIYYTLGG